MTFSLTAIEQVSGKEHKIRTWKQWYFCRLLP